MYTIELTGAATQVCTWQPLRPARPFLRTWLIYRVDEIQSVCLALSFEKSAPVAYADQGENEG